LKESGEASMDKALRISPSSLWRQEVAARAEELESLLTVFGQVDAAANDARSEHKRLLRTAAERHLLEARNAAQTRGLASSITGAPIQRAKHNLDMAEVTLYRIVPTDYLDSVVPVLIDDIADVLPANDNRLQRLIQLRGAHGNGRMDESDREAVVAAVYAAKKASLAAQARVRGFRNVLLAAIGLAILVATSIALVGLFAPNALSLCQPREIITSQGTVEHGLRCPSSNAGDTPSRYDNLFVMFVGVLGATIAAIFALRKVRGTADPYSVAVTLAMLKLPTGALTAFLGPFLIRGGFVPGFNSFDNSEQFISWGILFGYSQELFTSLVDRQAATVLGAVPNSGTSALSPAIAPSVQEDERRASQANSPTVRGWLRARWGKTIK
jgi:hypothetical protein